MTSVTVRRGAPADLPGVWEIYYNVEYRDRPPAPPRTGVPPIFLHELETGTLWIAERSGIAVGFAVTIVRGGVGWIAELFVDPRAQSHGIGRALLANATAGPADSYATMSSRDPRALSLYTRSGLTPRWPHLMLRVDQAAGGVRSVEDQVAAGRVVGDVELAEASFGDPDLVAWDARIGGRRRPEEHAYWQAQAGTLPMWFRRGRTTVGYGYGQRRPVTEGRPPVTVLGPIGAVAPTEVLACVAAAVRWARRHDGVIHIAVPGASPALAPLLNAGFRIADVETFCCSGAGYFDQRCYIASSGPEGTTLG